MEISTHEIRPDGDPAPSRPPLPLVAIVDSDPAICSWLQGQLEPSDCRCTFINLADYASGADAFNALAQEGVQLIVYDIGPRYELNQTRFRELANAAMGAEVELVITNVLRWIVEEREAAPATPVDELLPAAGERVVRQVRRALAARNGASSGGDPNNG